MRGGTPHVKPCRRILAEIFSGTDGGVTFVTRQLVTRQ